METIEQQAKSIIENYLKANKIGFTCDSETDDYYTLFLGSEEAHIQVEYSENKIETGLCAQFWIGRGDDDIYHTHPPEDEMTTAEDIEGEIDQLVDATKSFTRLKAKIEGYLDKINEAIDAANLGIEHDITIDDFFTEHY